MKVKCWNCGKELERTQKQLELGGIVASTCKKCLKEL